MRQTAAESTKHEMLVTACSGRELFRGTVAGLMGRMGVEVPGVLKFPGVAPTPIDCRLLRSRRRRCWSVMRKTPMEVPRRSIRWRHQAIRLSPMRSKELGATGVQIPEIGIGTWHYHAGPEPLRKGLDFGAAFIDTAESYSTEPVVAEAIAGQRERVFLATKVSPDHFGRADVIKAADKSLQQLRTDYIDLYQLHKPNAGIPIAETLGAVEELVDAGKVRFIGVSNFTAPQLQQAQKAMRKYPVTSNQVRFNLIDRTISEGLLPYCQANRITVIAYSPLARGFHHILDCDPNGVLTRLAKISGKTPAQVALNWCLCHDAVVVIPKGNSVQHVLENCGASDWRLSSDQVRELNETIAFRCRGSLETFFRSHLPATGKRAIQSLLRVLPRALRRRTS